MKRKDTFWRFFIILIAVAIPFAIQAEDKWIGKWRAEPFKVDTESMTMILEFSDSTNMVMGFETDNRIPGVGECLSYISVKGTYNKIGPIFMMDLDEATLDAEIKKLVLKNKSVTPDKLKRSMQKMLLANAKSVFSGYDGGMMIYVTVDDPDKMSFIIGDETNAMEMNFTRIIPEKIIINK
ncbi:MAG: hypothetical protein K2N91_04900 [Muribaculaceae bacterium]|nr:hypothetical protein [Muribaculaceae bacterium]